jgi:hypothetical protein
LLAFAEKTSIVFTDDQRHQLASLIPASSPVSSPSLEPASDASSRAVSPASFNHDEPVLSSSPIPSSSVAMGEEKLSALAQEFGVERGLVEALLQRLSSISVL